MNDTLIQAARQARENAFAPFSNFRVGAALVTEDDQIITGCNVESASYGLTMCAERVAVFKAVSEGHKRFSKIAVVADTQDLTPPCGACRQVLWEFGGNAEVLLANSTGDRKTFHMRELLPNAFAANYLKK